MLTVYIGVNYTETLLFYAQKVTEVREFNNLPKFKPLIIQELVQKHRSSLEILCSSIIVFLFNVIFRGIKLYFERTEDLHSTLF